MGGSTFSSAGPGKPRELDLYRTTRAETYKAVHWVASQPRRQPRWQPYGDMTCVNEPGQLNIMERTGLTLASLFPKKYGSQESLKGAQQARWEGARHLCSGGRVWLAEFEGNVGRSDVLRGPQGCERQGSSTPRSWTSIRDDCNSNSFLVFHLHLPHYRLVLTMNALASACHPFVLSSPAQPPILRGKKSLAQV